MHMEHTYTHNTITTRTHPRIQGSVDVVILVKKFQYTLYSINRAVTIHSLSYYTVGETESDRTAREMIYIYTHCRSNYILNVTTSCIILK